MSNSDWGMRASEMARWANKLASGWDWSVWENLLFSLGLIALWLMFLSLAVIGVIRPLRRRWASFCGVTVTPMHGGISFVVSAFVFSLAHAAIFGEGVIAYWVNTALPPRMVEALAETSFKYLSVVGWIFA